MPLNLYLPVRPLIGTGDLLLWHGGSIIDELIMVIDHNQSKILPEKVDHASCVLKLQGITDFRLFNYESLEHGFEPHFLSTELEKYDGSVYWLRLRGGQYLTDIEERMFRYDGVPYGYRQLFSFPFHDPEFSTSEMICSQSIQAVVLGQVDGLILSPGTLPDLGRWEEPIQVK
jgi:hypothetical protein